MRAEDKSLWANNDEGFNHVTGPRKEPVKKLSRRNRVVMDPVVTAPE